MTPAMIVVAILLLDALCLVHSIRINPSTMLEEERPSVQSFWRNKRRRRRNLSSPFQVQLPTHPDEHLVQSLPGFNQSLATPHWAGHLPVSEDGTKFFFYWLFAPLLPNDRQNASSSKDRKDEDIPLVIWLNGGPGCSSMNGIFLENGPFHVTQLPGGGDTLESSATSWHTLPAYMLYIDQPIGTGLSYKTNDNQYVSTDEEMKQDLYAFLESFLTLHANQFVTSSWALNRPLYFSGESYAGHYIPLFVDYILQQNKQENSKYQMPVTGMALGNPWVDPYYQYAGAKAAYGLGLVGLSEWHAELAQEVQCQRTLPDGFLKHCDPMIPNILHNSISHDYRVSKFDVRRSETRHGRRKFPNGKETMSALLRDEAVLQALHAWEGAQAATFDFEDCQHKVSHRLAYLDPVSMVSEVVNSLHENVKVLFYNGVFDMVCHHVGTEASLDHLPWDYRENWVVADRLAWFVNNELAGYLKRHRNLYFMKVLNAGHMVPLDVPEAARSMIQSFVYDEFDGPAQDLEVSHSRSCVCCGMARVPFVLDWGFQVGTLLLLVVVVVVLMLGVLYGCVRCMGGCYGNRRRPFPNSDAIVLEPDTDEHVGYHDDNEE